MITKHYSEVEATRFYGEDSEGVIIRPVVSHGDGAPTFATRYFEIEPGGYTPKHSHPWEHEIFILSGTGTVLGGETVTDIKAGMAIFIPGNEEHQFKNTGEDSLIFTCAVPLEGQPKN